MDRKEKRQKIDQAIKEITIPFLREKGFKGSLPHFRRQQSDGINLLTFQHSLYDTKFVVEIANCPAEGIVTHWGKVISGNKMTAHNMSERHRLGSEKHNIDFWFDYGKKSLFGGVNKKIANEIIQLWDDAESWWKKDPFEQKSTKHIHK